tara:strand:- start:548 stop:691 length:144 start_codon:yes stop_codon:yes gene_type:complete
MMFTFRLKVLNNIHFRGMGETVAPVFGAGRKGDDAGFINLTPARMMM